MVKDREAWRAAVHGGHKESDTTEQLPRKTREGLKKYKQVFRNIY